MALASGTIRPASGSSDIFVATADSPIVCTSQYRGPLNIFLIGAGGTGARVMPPLTQMLRQGDRIAIIDDDIVEDRNLARQHFSQRDTGRHKAVVLAERYAKPGRIEVSAHTVKLNRHDVLNIVLDAIPITSMSRLYSANVFLGCVDNARARAAIQAAIHALRLDSRLCAWIDVGNETRGGQVLMTLGRWTLRLSAGAYSGSPGHWTMPTMESAMPQLLVARSDDTASCGERLDLQTVQVNHLAAASMINCLSWLMLGIPFTAAGAFFSTLNTMQPIKIAKANFPAMTLNPETTFADTSAEV